MVDRQLLGRMGEEEAVRAIERSGLVVLDRNWHFGHKEIDIVARDRNDLVVIEVKTRTAPVIELPEQIINREKRRFLVAAAHAYVRYYRIPLEVRFDVVMVIYDKGRAEVSHIRNAFYPTL